MTNDKSPAKVFKRQPVQKFIDTAQSLNVTFDRLAEMLGYAPNSHGKWRAEGEMPSVVALACEALLRQAGRVHDGHIYVLRTKNGTDSTALEAFCTALKIEAKKL